DALARRPPLHDGAAQCRHRAHDSNGHGNRLRGVGLAARKLPKPRRGGHVRGAALRTRAAPAMRRKPAMATLWGGSSARSGLPAAMPNDRHARAPTDGSRTPAATATRAEIDAFLAKVKGLAPTAEPGRRGRLIFALDATMSRQPLWDTACR